MNRRPYRSYFLGTLGALGAPFGCSLGCSAAATDTYTLRMNVGSGGDTANGLAALQLAAAVNRRSKGRLTIEVYPSNQLAKEDASIEALMNGVIDVSMQASAILVPLFPQYQVFDTPFLVRNVSAGFRVLDGPIGQELFAQLEPKGILGLAWGTDGFRVLATTSKAVTVPEDMKGLRVRIQSGAVYVATYQALGAIPVVIDPSELSTALTQHTVDGTDFPFVSVANQKLYVIVKHVAMTNHVLGVVPVFANKRKIEALPLALKTILKEEVKALVPFWRSLTAQRVAAASQVLKSNGVAFTEIQYAGFRKAMDPIYAGVQSKLGGDLLDRISRVANAT
jgi:TRAP-type transport system periplasmic protein